MASECATSEPGWRVIPRRLFAPPPSWDRRTDVVVVGSGIAGMMVALNIAQHGSVLLLTKAALDAGSTSWAQGGIAATVDVADSTDQHVHDTLVAGVDLCSERAVRVLVEEGPQQLARLISYGAHLDTNAAGDLSLTIEGGHGRARIVHAGGDATGAEVQRALMQAIHEHPAIEVVENAFVLDVILTSPTADGSRQACGVVASVLHDDVESVGAIYARAVVMATGGCGQVYGSTTNPPVATGDGVAAALRAGALVADAEFVQFHPTVLWEGPGRRGQRMLISEAVRGEGATLLDATGRRIMQGVHPLEDLAPRDVVAKAIAIRLAQAPGGVDDHVFLDATRIDPTVLLRRFLNIVARCRDKGIDPVAEPIPVAPGEHFSCGGIWTDRNGNTNIGGLMAVGENACTGVHGANRLASNSLLEGLVFGERVGGHLALHRAAFREPDPEFFDGDPGETLWGFSRTATASVMSTHAGVRRTGEGLETAWTALTDLRPGQHVNAERQGWEATNVMTVAAAILHGAQTRSESRGCHWRQDFPDTSPEWQRRIVSRLNIDGTLHSTFAGCEDTP